MDIKRVHQNLLVRIKSQELVNLHKNLRFRVIAEHLKFVRVGILIRKIVAVVVSGGSSAFFASFYKKEDAALTCGLICLTRILFFNLIPFKSSIIFFAIASANLTGTAFPIIL